MPIGVHISHDEFVERATAIFGDRYDYTQADWGGKDRLGRVTIVCRKHGPFRTKPSLHLRGQGCRYCVEHKGQLTPVSTRVRQARSVHGNRYDYTSILGAVNNKTKVPIGCALHGIFWQNFNHHLRGVGCPKCNRGKLETAWLDSFLPDTAEHRQVRLPLIDGSWFVADGYYHETNTVYEFFGQYWHGDPRHNTFIDGTRVNRVTKQSHDALTAQMLAKINKIRQSGYRCEFIFERDWLAIVADEHVWQKLTQTGVKTHQCWS